MKNLLLILFLSLQTFALGNAVASTEGNTNQESQFTRSVSTSEQAYNAAGEKVWECALDIYGKAMTVEGEASFVPFRYQGQYEDCETGLCYNRFRYYSADSGTYISKDPIGLFSGEMNLYSYVNDSNSWVDPFGLATVDAVFEMGGQTFSGVNPTERVPRVSGQIDGLSAINNNEFKMHAEIDAMTQAKKAGLNGGKGTLTVKGKNVCPYCKGDIKKMAQSLGLDEFIVNDADGKTYKFFGDDLKPIKNGGKGYKPTCS